MNKRDCTRTGWMILAGILASLGIGCAPKQEPPVARVPSWLMEFSARPVKVDLDLLFIHHSCGSNWLDEKDGGLEGELKRHGFRVHSATYGSTLGQHTNVDNWYPKFKDHMDTLLRIEHQDELMPEGRLNRVVLFKSCFPNNQLHPPGVTTEFDPHGIMTVDNFKLAYTLLLPLLRARPDVLFVALSAPPLRREDTTPENGACASEFNRWLLEEWARQAPNVAVFDLFGLLATPEGYLRYPTADSHPSREGNRFATQAFTPFLFRAMRRAGLIEG